jgi:hypothetical protein
MTRHRTAIAAGVALALGCSRAAPPQPPIVPPSAVVAEPAQRQPSCAVVPTVVARKATGWSDSITLPASGRLVLESHLATTAESFRGRPFPATVTEGIDQHLARSCAALRQLAVGQTLGTDCAQVYRTRDHRQFTPAEGGGVAGQGAIAKKPPPEEEAWIINMMFARASLPPPGERWLVSANGRSAVVVAGYEIGPSDQRLLGGVQGEVHWYLGTGNADVVTVHGPLRDQSLPPGPVTCE